MAIIKEVDENILKEWLSNRPKIIQELVEKIKPGRLYLLKTSNHRVIPYSYFEDGTVSVIVSSEYNALIFERIVFDVSPDDLIECDLPPDGEQVGALLTNSENIKEFCNEYREYIKDSLVDQCDCGTWDMKD